MSSTLQSGQIDNSSIARSIPDISGILTSVISKDFVFTYLNRNAEKMVSIPREILLSGKMCELLPINRELGLFDAYKKVIHTGEVFVAEVPIWSGAVYGATASDPGSAV